MAQTHKYTKDIQNWGTVYCLRPVCIQNTIETVCLYQVRILGFLKMKLNENGNGNDDAIITT